MRYIKRILSWILCVCMVLSLGIGVQTPTQAATTYKKIRVSCVGDSITFGLNSSSNETTYPSQLQKLLGDDYIVSKYGACGAFACESKDVCWYPYITTSDYKDSLTSNPDVVIIMLGTNDAAESMCWGKRNQGVDIQKHFRDGYENLINTYLNLPSKPQIILATPVTVSRNTHANDGDPSENDHRQKNNTEGTIPIIKELAEKYNLPLVDMQSYTADWTCDNYLSDGLHPNDAGYKKLAEKFKEAVFVEDPIRVTCVGDSITDGYKASDGEHTYPAQLQKILGYRYKVFNAGVSGRTVIRSSDQAYSTTDRYREGLASEPDKVIIMLGTNDAVLSGITTEEKKAEFKRDYEQLIKEYQNCGTNPEIMIALQTTCEADDRNGHNEDILIPIVRSIAEEYNLQVLDAHEYSSSWTNDDFLADGLHPNDAGYERLAQYFASYIKGTANSILSNREYRIISKHSGKAFAIENDSKQNSARLCQMSKTGGNSQRWILEATDDGFYQIVNKSSGKALEVPGGSTKLETEIVQNNKTNEDNQKWLIELNADGSYRITPKIAMTLALDVKANSVDNGTPIIQWTYGGGNNQKWEFELLGEEEQDDQVIQQGPLESGATYSIQSAMNRDYALMPENSRPGWTNIVLFDNTGSNSQKWVVNQDGDNYNIKNVGTDLNLHYQEGVKDAEVDQNGFDDSDFYKWKLTKIDSGSYEGGYMVEAVKKADDGNPVYLTADKSDRGTKLYVRSENRSNQASQVWYFEKTENVENAAITPDKVEKVSQAFLDKYYVDTKQSDGSTRKSLGGGFWVGAELLEIMLDGYQTTGDNRYRQAFESSYLDEVDNIGNRFPYWTEMTETNWERNPYNDDIMWLTIACARAYLLFGNGDTEFTDYLSNAKNNFDMVYERGLKDDGTLVWCHEEQYNGGTTSCINGPATVAACYLAKATGDTSYYEKAKNIHEAQRNMLFDASTGHVHDSPSNSWASTYNQGTWIGSCVLLYEYYHDQQYMDDAMKAMDFVIEKKGAFSDDYGILKSEDATTGGDLPVFRSIMMRYIRMMIVEFASEADMTPYLEWMQKNARVAYNNQNIHGLIQTPYNKAIPNVVVYKDGDNSPEITDVGYKAPGMSGAVSLMLNLPTFENTVIRNAFERIEAEKFDYVKGIMTETTSDVDGNRQVSGVKNDYYTAYSNVDFGNKEAKAIELRVSTASAGSYVEVHLDKLDGELLGKVELPYTNDWSVYATVKANIKPVSGKHTIYLVYKNDENDYVCNVNWLVFSSNPIEELQENENYAIVSKNSEKAMTIEDYSSEDAAKVCQMTLSNYESQTWTLQDAGDGYYYIVNKFSGKVLSASDSATEQGAIIEQAQKADVDSQKWKFEATDDDCYRITPKLAEHQALEVSEASGNDGAYILQNNFDGTENQKWQLVAVKDVVANPEVTETDPSEPSNPSTPSTPSAEKYTVHFDYSDGTAVISKIVKNGQKVQEPAEPLRNGYMFKGWYLEETEYNFETEITGDITLTAKWELTESEEEFSEAKENLAKAIKKAESKKASDYTETTWKAYESALEKAESIQNNEESTLADLQDALVELEKAERNLSEEDDATTNKPDDNGNTNNNNGNTNNNNGNTNNNNGNTNNNNGNTNNNNDNTNNNNGNTNNNNGNTNNNNGNTNNNNGNTNNNNGNTNNNNNNTNNTNNTNNNNNNNNPPVDSNQGGSTPVDSNPVEGTPGATTEDMYKVDVTFEKGKLVYKITKSTATEVEVQVVKPTKNTNSSISIPSTVTFNGKKCIVTSIAKNAFKSNTKLKKVTIGKNVVNVGEKAFYNCKKLSTVTFKKNNLKNVGKGAFLKTANNLKIKTGSKQSIKKYEELFKKKIPSNAKIMK